MRPSDPSDKAKGQYFSGKQGTKASSGMAKPMGYAKSPLLGCPRNNNNKLATFSRLCEKLLEDGKTQDTLPDAAGLLVLKSDHGLLIPISGQDSPVQPDSLQVISPTGRPNVLLQHTEIGRRENYKALGLRQRLKQQEWQTKWRQRTVSASKITFI